jgi:hypothetical protein
MLVNEDEIYILVLGLNMILLDLEMNQIHKLQMLIEDMLGKHQLDIIM